MLEILKGQCGRSPPRSAHQNIRFFHYQHFQRQHGRAANTGFVGNIIKPGQTDRFIDQRTAPRRVAVRVIKRDGALMIGPFDY
ncbi:hypothetical protein D3C87_1858370 [compost metagenome]